MGAGIVFRAGHQFGFYLGEGTNQIAELAALYLAISGAQPDDQIFTDSMYAINITTGRWRAHMHKSLVNVVRKEYINKGKVKISWVRGHAGNWGNLLADESATRAVKERKSSSYSGPIIWIDNGQKIDAHLHPEQEKDLLCQQMRERMVSVLEVLRPGE